MIHEHYKQFCVTSIMKDSNNNSNSSWEEVRGLSWIFTEE
jgi:hypothetical protein